MTLYPLSVGNGVHAAEPRYGFSADIRIRYGVGRHTCVLIHNNEKSASAAARYGCGKIVELINKKKRRVTLYRPDGEYTFDPNRIFSKKGIQKTLKPYKKAAAREVNNFAQALLRIIGPGPIIAPHNNTDGRYSIKSYLEGGSEYGAMQAININSANDADNFFLVTEAKLFNDLKELGYNVVLQKKQPPDDGSLSVYCAKHKRPYVNVEVQHGKTQVQIEMMQALLD